MVRSYDPIRLLEETQRVRLMEEKIELVLATSFSDRASTSLRVGRNIPYLMVHSGDGYCPNDNLYSRQRQHREREQSLRSIWPDPLGEMRKKSSEYIGDRDDLHVDRHFINPVETNRKRRSCLRSIVRHAYAISAMLDQVCREE